VLGAREACSVVDGACTRCTRRAVLDLFIQVLCEDEEPACAEHAGVDGVDEGVEDEDECQADNLERLLGLPDGGEEPCDQSEDDEGVDVVAELERVEMVAGEDGEDAVEAGDLVEEDSEEDEFGGGAEGDEAQYGLRRSEVSMVCAWSGCECDWRAYLGFRDAEEREEGHDGQSPMYRREASQSDMSMLTSGVLNGK
jgi:hypothetical protein